MGQLIQAKEPFIFYTRLNLAELTGLRAATLKQLFDIIEKVSDLCIYYHTHRFLQQHQYLSPEPPNDFAYWVTNVLGESELGEELASIDIIQFDSISELRDTIAAAIKQYMERKPASKARFAGEGEEFHFIKSISFVFPTAYTVHDLAEFTEALKKTTIDSIYFHIFEARLRLGKGANDFSNWIENALEDPVLAAEISRLDPYTHTLEELREKIIKIIERRMKSRHG